MRVLGLVDFSDDTAAVLKAATDLARALAAELLLLHVATPDADRDDEDDARGADAGRRGRADRPRDLSRNAQAAELRREHRALTLLALEREKLGIPTTARVARSTSARGNPVDKILRELRHLRPDYVVVGSHGHGPIHEVVLGSVSRAVVRRSTCPVLVVPSTVAHEARSGPGT